MISVDLDLKGLRHWMGIQMLSQSLLFLFTIIMYLQASKKQLGHSKTIVTVFKTDLVINKILQSPPPPLSYEIKLIFHNPLWNTSMLYKTRVQSKAHLQLYWAGFWLLGVGDLLLPGVGTTTNHQGNSRKIKGGQRVITSVTTHQKHLHHYQKCHAANKHWVKTLWFSLVQSCHSSASV